MVGPVRELANKHFLTSISTLKSQNIAKLPSRMDMDINDTIRKRSTFLNRITSRNISIISNILSCTYHLKMEHNNDLSDDMAVDPINNSQLLYSGDVEAKGNLVSKKIFDPISAKESQCIQHNNSILNKAPKP